MDVKAKKDAVNCNKIKKDMQAFEKCRFVLGMIDEQQRSTVKKVIDGAVEKVGGIVAGFQEKRFKRGRRHKIVVKKLYKDTEFVPACEIILDMMTEVINCWEMSEPILNREEIFYLKSQVQSKEIIISFYGDSNVGKSTLLNSIMGDRYLPTEREAETAASVYIQFQCNDLSGISSTEEIEIGQSDILYEGESRLFVAEGTNNIKVALQKKNKSIRNHSIEQVSLEFHLKLCHPFGSPSSSTQNFSMVDNPGFGEFNSGMISASVKKVQDISSAFVFVTSLETYRDGDLSRFIKQIYSKNPEAVKQTCVTIVINKMDDALMPIYDEDSYTKERIISTVHEYLCGEVFGCTSSYFPKTSIILVCGLWALLSRQYQNNLGDKKLLQFIHHEMQKLTIIEEFAEKQEYKFQHEHPIKDRVDLLERSSNIAELENRLQEITKDSFLWIQKMTLDIEHQMDSLSAYLNSQIETHIGDVLVQEDVIKQHYDIILQVMKLYNKVNRGMKRCRMKRLPTGSSKWKMFKIACQMDIKKVNDIQSILEIEVKQTLENFKYTTTDKISKRQHRPEDLERDLKETLEFLLRKINYILTSRNIFYYLSEVYYKKTSKIHNQTLTLKSILSRLLNQQGSMDQFGYAPQIPYPKLPGPSLKISLNIPQQMNFFQKFLQMIRSFLHLPASQSSEYPCEIEVGTNSTSIVEQDFDQSLQFPSQVVETSEDLEEDTVSPATCTPDGTGQPEFSLSSGLQKLDPDWDVLSESDIVKYLDTSESSESDDSDTLRFNAESLSSASDYDIPKVIERSGSLSSEKSASNLVENISDTRNSRISLSGISYEIDTDRNKSSDLRDFGDSENITFEKKHEQAEISQLRIRKSMSHSPVEYGMEHHNDCVIDSVEDIEENHPSINLFETKHESKDEISKYEIKAGVSAGVKESSQEEISKAEDNLVSIKETSQEQLCEGIKHNSRENSSSPLQHDDIFENNEQKQLKMDTQNSLKFATSELDTSQAVHTRGSSSTLSSEPSLGESASRKHSQTEPREKSAYRKWTSQLESVKNQIKDDVIKEIHAFFDDLETNVVKKYYEQHCEAACTILRQFDSYTAIDMETCKENLKSKMFALEHQRNMLEDLKKHKALVDEMRKKFEGISSSHKIQT